MSEAPELVEATLTAAEPASVSMTSPQRFINRELSWLAFNMRVLEEAQNARNPLLERLRFLSISSSNWDEFYMVRVAGLKGQLEAGITSKGQDGLNPAEQLAAILKRSSELREAQQACWQTLQDELRQEGIAVQDPKALSGKDKRWLEREFLDRIFPLLTPMAVDPGTAFPFIPNLGFCLFLQLERPDGKTMYALIPVPKQTERFIRLPEPGIRFILLEDLIDLFLDRLFPSFRSVRS